MINRCGDPVGHLKSLMFLKQTIRNTAGFKRATYSEAANFPHMRNGRVST